MSFAWLSRPPFLHGRASHAPHRLVLIGAERLRVISRAS
ncbi:hypothetical protein AKJ09_00563 [Labilithrix luteola]|uniref:Uncharacterized protein n=1 Tax=Labilithrix luteola TaxID=1391654 RepID=A0A0K1PLA6_9BACT|nr:hypothetical protein AKJ09_00563 [Labilithrix luteola]